MAALGARADALRAFSPMVRLKKNMWVEVACAPQLCPGAKRAANAGFFGNDVDDFRLLAEALAWEFPQGGAFIHVDKQCTVVCIPGRPVHAAHVTSALSWLRSLRWQTFGIVLRSAGDRAQGAFLDVLFQPRRDGQEMARRRRAVLKAVAEVTSARY